MVKTNNLIGVLLIVLIFLSIDLFDLKILQTSLFTYFKFGLILSLIFYSLQFFFISNKGFSISIKLITVAMLFSIFTAFYSWGQSPLESLIATSGILLWPLYFTLKKFSISIYRIERTIVFFSIIYTFAYFFQYVNVSKVYFGWEDEIELSRGVYRFVLTGLGGLIFTIFLSLNMLTEKKTNKWYWFSILAVGISIIVLQATRQTIGALFLIFIYHFFIRFTVKQKTIAIGLLFLTIIGSLRFILPIVEGISNEQEKTQELGSEYIRIKSADYFATELSPNILSKVLGNGVPYGDKSIYGKFMTNLSLEEHYYMSDVGITGIYAMFGMLAIIAYFIIWSKSFTYKLPSRFIHLKYYMWYLLLTFFTSDYAYSKSFLIFNILVIYSFDVVYIEYDKYLIKKRL